MLLLINPVSTSSEEYPASAARPAGVFRPAFVQRSDALQLLQHFHRHVVPDALRVAELQIQHRRLR